MLRTRDDIYSASDYKPITYEHFMRRCSAPVDDVPVDEPEDNDDWQDIQDVLH